MDDKEVILKVENLSKQYRLGLVGTGTLSHDFNRWWHRIRGKEDPYLKIGETNDRSTKGESEYVWALRDINFEVKRGEVLGIIGKNGAGKSTLLKILSRVTSPTTGSIKTKGRIASLLEVGTGFHGEMTGRENIYLNGAILGMTKKEITAKIDEIIEFSGCERYIDTPVKRYSSGMTVRLAFAVAAFLEPDILIVDEVLAVGDAEFQKKAIGKMQDISSGEGRTVIFVSHNLKLVKYLSKRIILIEHGLIKFEGCPESALNIYYANESNLLINHHAVNFSCPLFSIREVYLGDKLATRSNFNYDDEIHVWLSIVINSLNPLFSFILRLNNHEGETIMTSWDIDSNLDRKEMKSQNIELRCVLPSKMFKPGMYFITIEVAIPGEKILFQHKKILSFKISWQNCYFNEGRSGIIYPTLFWDYEKRSVVE